MSVKHIARTQAIQTSATESGDFGHPRSRIGSTGSLHYHHGAGRRRNTNRSLASANSSSVDPHGDHVEIDFDAASCASIESPMNRSRQSSVGVQLPNSMRAALDSLASVKNSLGLTSSSLAGSYRSHRSNVEELECDGEVKRKGSVPEIGTDDGAENRIGEQQRRRSTYDNSTVNITKLAPVETKLLEAGIQDEGNRAGDTPPTLREGGRKEEADEDGDYVLMAPDPAMPPQRVISTIVESISSSPSCSSTDNECDKNETNQVQEQRAWNNDEDEDYGFIVGQSLSENQQSATAISRGSKPSTSKGKESKRISSTGENDKTDYTALAPNCS